MEMTDENQNDHPFLPTLFPYLISAMDQYYGVNQPSEEKQSMETVQIHSAQIENKSLKILITTFWEYPFIGGLQNYITALKTGLENLGHTVHVVAPNHFPSDEMEILRDRYS